MCRLFASQLEPSFVLTPLSGRAKRAIYNKFKFDFTISFNQIAMYVNCILGTPLSGLAREQFTIDVN